jgi:hypothetical protein
MTQAEVQAIADIQARLGNREWRIDNLYHIESKSGETIKFVRNESQRQFWDDMWYMNIILKDRQRGFSTLIAIFILDYCLFNSGTTAGIIDLTIDDAKKKLKKIKFAYDLLPDFIKDAVKILTDNKEAIEWNNGSSVHVGTSHRGGTLQILHISEMGAIAVRFPERAKEIRTGALNTVAPGQIVFNESTAMGSAGEFYDDCQTAQRRQGEGRALTNMDYRFHFFSWWMGTDNEMEPEGITIPASTAKYLDDLEAEIGLTLSPHKRAWYARKKEQQRDDMQREYPGTPEEAFASAIEGAFYAMPMAHLRRNGRIREVPWEPSMPVHTFWDLGMNDAMTVWFYQRIGLEGRLLDYYQNSGEGFQHYAKILKDKGYHYGNHYMPHDVGVRELGNNGLSRKEAAENLGIRPIIKVPRPKNTEEVLDGIEAVRAFLMTCWIDEKMCSEGIKALDNYRKDWDDKNGTWRRGPLHDWASHGADALRTGATGFTAQHIINERELYPEAA